MVNPGLTRLAREKKQKGNVHVIKISPSEARKAKLQGAVDWQMRQASHGATQLSGAFAKMRRNPNAILTILGLTRPAFRLCVKKIAKMKKSLSFFNNVKKVSSRRFADYLF